MTIYSITPAGFFPQVLREESPSVLVIEISHQRGEVPCEVLRVEEVLAEDLCEVSPVELTLPTRVEQPTGPQRMIALKRRELDALVVAIREGRPPCIDLVQHRLLQTHALPPHLQRKWTLAAPKDVFQGPSSSHERTVAAPARAPRAPAPALGPAACAASPAVHHGRATAPLGDGGRKRGCQVLES